MRRILFATLTVMSAVAAFGSMSPASANQDRFCLQGRQFGYPGNCQFSTYQQCMATASGTDSGCGINPMVAYNSSGYSNGRSGHSHGPYYR